MDPWAIGQGAVLGGLTGGALAKVMGRFSRSTPSPTEEGMKRVVLGKPNQVVFQADELERAKSFAERVKADIAQAEDGSFVVTLKQDPESLTHVLQLLKKGPRLSEEGVARGLSIPTTKEEKALHLLL